MIKNKDIRSEMKATATVDMRELGEIEIVQICEEEMHKYSSEEV